MSRRLLVTGASGLLGRYVAAFAAQAGWQVTGTYNSRPIAIPGVSMVQLDLPRAAAQLVAELQPSAVIHTAYTRQAGLMWPVIVDGSAELARASAATGARLIHLSSDALFAGREQPYTENDDPDPVFPYGAAKAAAEAVVAALYPAALLVRTSLIYTPPGAEPADPYLAMARQLLADPALGALFTDEIRCPICVEDLARALLELLDGQERGVLNIAGPEPLSRYEFGRLQLRSAGIQPDGLPAGSAAAMRRPSSVVLDSSRARNLLRTELRSPRVVLRESSYDPHP